MIYVVADDLTGANDTGVQFSKKGYRTVVSILYPASEPVYSEDTDVLVVDLETREEGPEVAKTRVRDAVGALSLKDFDTVYKKVDSTLRGCIGAEIEELLSLLEMDICVFSPTFASNHRITVGGYLIVQGEILELSNYFNGLGEPGDASYIPSLLRSHTSLPVSTIELRDVAKGPEVILKRLSRLTDSGAKIVVCDSTNERHLHDIVKSCRKFDGFVLYAGSAGLADQLPAAVNEKRATLPPVRGGRGGVLLVYATRQPVMRAQISCLKKKYNVQDINVNLDSIFDGGRSVESYADRCISALGRNEVTVLHTDPVSNDQSKVNDRLQVRHGISGRELEIRIREFLGEVARPVVMSGKVKNLFLSGGDTALGVCSALGITVIRIYEELFPGIPLSYIECGHFQLNLVTKAGGFGRADTLCRIVSKFMTIKGEGL